nr:NAC25 [Coffea canephora]
MASGHESFPQIEASADTSTAVNVITSPGAHACAHHLRKDHENVLSGLNNTSTTLSSPSDSRLVDNGNKNHNVVKDDDDAYNNDAIDRDKDYFDTFPPGYRFCPMDSELIVCYLKKKILGELLPRNQIREVNLYRQNPDTISGRYPSMGDNQWFFFTPRDKKYLNGSRPNRAAGTGYWKATGADKNIHCNGVTVGVRKTLVFYEGRPPKGVKTSWIMHEYRVLGHHKSKSANDMRLDDYVLCKIYKKNHKSFKARQRNDENPGSFNQSNDGNPDDELVQQDELGEEKGSLFDPPPGSNEQSGCPYTYQANYTYPHLESFYQYPPSEQFPMLAGIQPLSIEPATNPDIAKYISNFPPHYYHHGAKPISSFMHPSSFLPIPPVNPALYPPTLTINAPNLKGGTSVFNPVGGGNIGDMVVQDYLDLPMDFIDYGNTNSVDPYLDLDKLSSHGFESPSMPQDSHGSQDS